MEMNRSLGATVAYMAAQASSIQHAADHPSLAPTAADARSAPTTPFHSIPFHSIPLHSIPLHSIPPTIATCDCIPLDVNLNPLSGKGMFSEFKSKGWMAQA